MIVAVEGRVVKKEPTYVSLKTLSGVTYKIVISLYCSSSIKDNVVELMITQVIREDANLLFGFLEVDEQKMFEKLIKVNGIGPATAIAICSTLTPAAFSAAIIKQDTVSLTKVPGIGIKSAKRILVELGDFMLDSSMSPASTELTNASLALEALGFKKERVRVVLHSCKTLRTEDLIKEALGKLQ